ncbi:MAG: hypothetical protein VR69_00185 [Peptococcaceae bacterium BRH_c4b]|nr:MAG: hypothetical protein VR69_00185 [Peptococcaceae bacterium BRH_c4b]
MIDLDTKKQWASILIRLKRNIKRVSKERKEVTELRRQHTERLKTEEEKTFKNQYYIAELREAILELDETCNSLKGRLAMFGEFLYDALPAYEATGSSDHDFAQLINCNIRKMEEHRQDFNSSGNQGHSFFVDAVFVYNAELPLAREKEDFISDFTELPFFDAMRTHFMFMLEVNQKMRQAAHDALDEVFPEMRAHQYIVNEGPDGVTLEKYYPPLKLVKMPG